MSLHVDILIGHFNILYTFCKRCYILITCTVHTGVTVQYVRGILCLTEIESHVVFIGYSGHFVVQFVFNRLYLNQKKKSDYKT